MECCLFVCADSPWPNSGTVHIGYSRSTLISASTADVFRFRRHRARKAEFWRIAVTDKVNGRQSNVVSHTYVKSIKKKLRDWSLITGRGGHKMGGGGGEFLPL